MEAETKQGYKNTKIGWIPEEWKVFKVGEICDCIVPGRNKPKIFDGDIPWITTPNLSNYGLVVDSNYHLSLNEIKNSGAKIVPKGSVIFSCVGELGIVAIAGRTIVINQQLHAFIPPKELNNYFLMLSLSMQTKYIESIATKTAVPYLNKDNCNSIPIPLPPLPEQQKIAQILSTWDKAIEQSQNLIEQFKSRKKGLMQQLLTGKTRLKGFSGEWSISKLGIHLTKYNEVSTASNQYPVLTSSRRGLFFQKDYYTREVASTDNTGYNVVPRGYFTYRHMSDDLIFKFNINTICDKGIVSTLYPVFTSKPSINKEYLLFALNEGNEFKRYALMQKQGGSRTYMYYGKLSELKLNLPSLEEQGAIVKVLTTADKEIKAQETHLAQLQAQKKGLMQQLLTGQKRVKIV